MCGMSTLYTTSENYPKGNYTHIMGDFQKLSQNQIRDSLIKTANKYPIKSVSLFGSYADGNANEERDVDLVHLPIPPNSIIKINKVATLYENLRRVMMKKLNAQYA